MRRNTLIWTILALVTLLSMALATMRLQNLPRLPVAMGPDLKVRSVRAHTEGAETHQLQRGDRMTSVASTTVKDMVDVRDAFRDAPPAGSSKREVAYQIVRPLYRFNLMLSGEPVDPMGLPPGVENGDMLVELDGRPMKPKVGTEGLRSIISSRPESLLVLERRDAVFTGQLKLHYEETNSAPIAIFSVVLVLMALLWRFGDPKISGWTSLAVGAETLALGWCAMILLQYQWILADPSLTYAATAGLMLARPLGTFARSVSAEASMRPGMFLGTGLLGFAILSGLLYGGFLPDAEATLQFTAILSVFFIIFEIAMTIWGEGAGMTLGERSIYLAGMVLLVITAAGIAYLVEPTEFGEERWRWFASILLALVWFGDVLFCFRGLPSTAFAEIATSGRRQDTIALYIEELGAEFPGLSLELVVHRENTSHVFRLEDDELTLGKDAGALHEAIAIMFQERTHVPSLDAPNDPLAGIADSMGIALALAFSAPDEAPTLEGTELAIVGMSEEDAEHESISLDDLDFIQSRMSPLVWSAALFESLALALSDGEMAAAPVEADEPEEEESEEEDLEARVDELTEELDTIRSKEQMLREERLVLTEQAELLRRWHTPPPALPPQHEALLEPELLDALTYLLESPEPLVITGAPGAGKTFIAATAHALDGSPLGPASVYDASLYADEAQLANLLGTPEAQGVLDTCARGALIIERAELLSSSMLLALLPESEALEVRVYLCFTDAEAEERSALAGHDESVLELLEHRELVVPSLARRSMRERAILHFFEESLFARDKPMRDISPAALRALIAYDYPGNLPEARALVDAAVARARGDFLEMGDLPADVRRLSF